MVDEAPVVHLTVLQHPLNDIGGAVVHGQLLWVGIPEQAAGESADTLLVAYDVMLDTDAKISIFSETAFICELFFLLRHSFYWFDGERYGMEMKY